MSDQEQQSLRREKRRELFKQQQEEMLRGYNQNSFKSSKPRKMKNKEKDRDGHKIRDKERRQKSKDVVGATDHHQNRKPQSDIIQQDPENFKNQQEFVEILDRMSMNSSSKLPSGNHGAPVLADQQNRNRDQFEFQKESNLNLSKSQSGFISSILKGQQIDMKIKDASLTINSNKYQQNAMNNLLVPSEIELQIDDELNKKQFEEENPYGSSQRLNMTDYHQRSIQNQSKNINVVNENEKGRHEKRHRSNRGPSAFEKQEELRFQCYELQQKMTQMTSLVLGVTQQISAPDAPGVNFEKQTCEVPLSFIEQMASFTQFIQQDFLKVQTQWNDNFDDQQNSITTQRSKSKRMRKKLKSLESKSQIQSGQSKEFEKSLQYITRAHDVHTSQMGQQLDQIESHVNNLKDTREFLNSRYEQQLDKAVKEMVNFYEKIEKGESQGEENSDNMSIEQVFFIKPTHQITQTIQEQRSKSRSRLKLSGNCLSAGVEQNPIIQPPPLRSFSSGQQRTPNIVPKLQIERMQENKSPDPPKIINVKKSQRGSARGYQQASQRGSRDGIQQQMEKSKENKNVCPRPSARGVAPKSSRQGSNRNIVSKRSAKQEDYITNPVMCGAMQLSSKFDKQYEDDFEGADQTLDMATERLRQFPEDYEAINSIDNVDERIILKQIVFMKYEKILKKQAKQEKKRKKKAQKKAMEDKQQVSNSKQEGSASKKVNANDLQFKPKSLIPTPTNKSSFGFGKFQNQQSSKGSLRGLKQNSSNSTIGNKNAAPQGLGINERHEYHDNSQLTSRFSLHSELPSLDTVDANHAQNRFRGGDVNQSELLECEEFFAHGMKTATQQSLIQFYDDEFKNKENIRQQHKAEEKKIDYNSTVQSKISLPASKQISQSSKQHQDQFLKNYGSNNSNGLPMYVASEDQSMCSEVKDIGKISNQKLKKMEQVSMKSKRSGMLPIDNRSFINQSGIDQSLNISVDIPSGEKGGHNADLIQEYDTKRDGYAVKKGAEGQVEESMVSNGSQYHRYLDNHEYNESPIVKKTQGHNSYLQSEDTPTQLNEQTVDDYDYHERELDIDDFQNHNKIYLDDEIMQRLPLDIIHERQSEFSQSMITNAKGVNTHRSMQSKKQNQYSNLPQNATVQKQQNSVGTILASNRHSDVQQPSSANRKNSSRGMQESFERRTQEFAEEQYRSIMIRSNSVAQTHRNPDNSFINPNFNNVTSIDDRPICIDGSLIHHSRNAVQKNASSSKDHAKKDGLQMYRQPSAGNFEAANRNPFFQSINDDLPQVKKPSVKSQAQALKNKINGNIPPKAKQISEKKTINTRNNAMYQNKTNQQKSNPMDQKEHHQRQGAVQQPLSYRSHNINNGGNESYREMRDRSYFDESPAIFDQQEIDEEQLKSFQREKLLEAKNTLSSNLVQNSIQSNLQSVQVYRTEETGDSISNQKFGSSIHTNMILQSIPQSSGQSSVRENNSKNSKNHQKSKESRKESLNQIDSMHHLSANQSHKELMLNSNSTPALKQINEHPEEMPETRNNFGGMIRSNSYVQLRDKEFYDMCLEDEDVQIAEQNLFDAIHLRMLSQSKDLNKQSGMQQSGNSPAQMFTSNIILNRISNRYQTHDKTQINQTIGHAPSAVDQNSSQQQTRGQRTFAKFLQDPILLASINERAGQSNNAPQMNHYLGTNLLTKSLDDGTLHIFNNLMNPSQYKRTILMMANLHNNYLHSANSGTLFTMQRGWNSGYSGEVGNIQAQIGYSYNNLTNMVRLRKEITSGQTGVLNGLNAEKQATVTDPNLKSLGGEPVNIANLLLGAKQQTTEKINIGSITIVDDDSKNLLDRKLFLDANISASQQTKGRKLINQSRNQNGGQGQQITTSDFSNLQTKQIGIFKARNSQNSMLNNKTNERKTSESINLSSIINDRGHETEIPAKSTPNQVRDIYGNKLAYSEKQADSSNNLSNDKIDESKSTIKPTPGSAHQMKSTNQNKIRNLLVGLKSIQKKSQAGNSSHRSGSDLSLNNQRDLKMAQNFRTIGAAENRQGQENIKKIIKFQQNKNMMNLSSSSALENNRSGLALKSKSVPKVNGMPPSSSSQMQLNQKLKGMLIESNKKANNKLQSSIQLSNDETIKNFNTITGNPHGIKVSNSQLSYRGKSMAGKNQRTNSSCMAQDHRSGSGGSFLVKKQSNGTTISSARNSSGARLNQQNIPDNLYIDQNGKVFVKKKISTNQYQTQNAVQSRYISNSSKPQAMK